MSKGLEDARGKGTSPAWWSEIVSKQDYPMIEHSGKLVLLKAVLRKCQAREEQLLVFSQSRTTLFII